MLKKWNGNGDMFGDLIKPNKLPSKLYHVSRKENRNDILKYGIFSSVGEDYLDWWNYEGPNGEIPDDEDIPDCVFLTVEPNTWSELAFEDGEFDVFEIDINKLDKENLFLDPDKSMRNRGSFCYTKDVPRNAIKLIDTIKINECGIQGGATPMNVGGMGDIILPGSGSPGSGDIPLPSPTGVVYKQIQPFDQFIKKNWKNRKIKKSKRKRRLEKNSDAEHTPNAPIYDYIDDFRTYTQRIQK